jgi:ribonuclease D
MPFAIASFRDFTEAAIDAADYFAIELFAPSAADRDVAIGPTPQSWLYIATGPRRIALRNTGDEIDSRVPLVVDTGQHHRPLAEKKCLDQIHRHGDRRAGHKIKQHEALPIRDARLTKLQQQDHHVEQANEDHACSDPMPPRFGRWAKPKYQIAAEQRKERRRHGPEAKRASIGSKPDFGHVCALGRGDGSWVTLDARMSRRYRRSQYRRCRIAGQRPVENRKQSEAFRAGSKACPIGFCGELIQWKWEAIRSPPSPTYVIVTTGRTRRTPTDATSHETITSPAALASFCEELAQADRIGMDTEFVSEDTFRPELCLIQVATKDRLAVIDPYRAGELTIFWKTLAAEGHITVVHAAREEVNFSLNAIDTAPALLFDTQLAAGFCSMEYPSSYGSVVTKFLDRQPNKGEQRTDWRRRPLTDSQIDYALEDVRFLLPLYDELQRRLAALMRLDWLAEETATWLDEVRASRERPRWRKVSGIGNMSLRSLAIVRELWRWRQAEAERRDAPPRRVLRDDLIVELAKRKSDQPEKIRAIRGIQQSINRQLIDQLAACIRRGLEVPLDDLEREPHESMPSQLNLLGQFLSPALTSICRSANVATSLAGTAGDVRDLIAYRLNFGGSNGERAPLLAQGWRAELVGRLIEDLLAGKKSIRIDDPTSEHPLSFDSV